MYTKSIQIGAIKYKSVKDAWKASCKIAERKGEKPLSYMTFYMRLRAAKMSPSKAMVKPARNYTKAPVRHETLTMEEYQEYLIEMGHSADDETKAWETILSCAA